MYRVFTLTLPSPIKGEGKEERGGLKNPPLFIVF
jgi:hypothetical protein